jgi:hypothetical protein
MATLVLIISLFNQFVLPFLQMDHRANCVQHREVEERFTFKSRDFIKITGYNVDLVQLNLALVHKLSPREKRLFLLVRDVRREVEPDAVLDIPRLQLLPSWRIIGLPAIMAKRIYIVARSRKLRAFKIDDIRIDLESFELSNGVVDGEGDLLHCPWEISFM